MRAPESRFERYMSERIVSLSFRAQSAKRTCLRFAIFNFSKKLQSIFEIGFKKYGAFVEKSLSLKNYFERKNSQTPFCCLCVNLSTVKIWGQSDKFPMSFSFLQCPLEVKKMIPENYLIFFNDFFFYIRDFIWIITLNE